MKIAVLGWGSLIYDPQVNINRSGGQNGWYSDGPDLALEFARISTGGILSLVIVEGVTKTQVLWALMSGDDIVDSIQNLARTELTGITHIESIILNHRQTTSFNDPVKEQIAVWAQEKSLDAVIWTALPENFASRVREMV